MNLDLEKIARPLLTLEYARKLGLQHVWIDNRRGQRITETIMIHTGGLKYILIYSKYHTLHPSDLLKKKSVLPPYNLQVERSFHHTREIIRDLAAPDSKVHETNVGPIWGRQDPGGPHVGPMTFAIWSIAFIYLCKWLCFKSLLYIHLEMWYPNTFHDKYCTSLHFRCI